MTTLVLLNLLLTLPQVLIYTYALCTTLRIKKQLIFVICNLILFEGLYIVMYLLPIPLQYLSAVVRIITTLLLTVAFSMEKRSTTLICTVAYVSATIFASVLLCSAFLPQQLDFMEIMQTDVSIIVCLKLIYLLLMTITFYWLRGFLCKQFKLTPKTNGWEIPLIVLLLNQVVVLGLLLYVIWGVQQTQWDIVTLVLAAGCTVLVSLCFASVLKSFQKDQALQKIFLQERLQLMEQQLDTQLQYYQSVRDNMQLVNQIRHDINNQLQTAYLLLQDNYPEAAREQLSEIQDNLKKRIGTVYCENLVADAVLVEKAGICNAEGVRLEADICIPEQIAVRGVHLCAVLANLLDNAIVAARESKMPWITVKAYIRAHCLFLSCTNSCSTQPKYIKTGTEELLPVHGVGMCIIKRIADTYQGEVQYKQEDGQFGAMIMLPLSVQVELENVVKNS